jgi:formylglycine-generating enzyme required for sulfatase activity/tetratricopeptide (TPR) repeat protein
MARIPNPYIVGTPIPSPEYFYGRESLLSFVRDTLNPPQQRVVVLYGQRRIGKTSVLYELARRLSVEFEPVYFDLMGQANRPLIDALGEIANHISDSLDTKPPPEFTTPLDFRNYLQVACDSLTGGRALLLLLDEFDDLSDEEAQSDAAAHTLFDYLRDLLNIRLPVAFVFVVGRRLTELPHNFQSILKQAPSRRVAFLDQAGTVELITRPAADMLSYSDAAVHAIRELASGHPYFTQLICFELFRLGVNRGNTRITAADVESVLDSAMETGKGGLAWFWDALPLAERFVMSAIAEISSPQIGASTNDVRELLATYDLRFLGLEVTDAPNLLVQWTILRETAGGYQFAVDLVRRWVVAEHPLAQAKREIENLVPRANRYFANAREAQQSGDITLAISDYRQALGANPHHLRAQLGLAQALEEKGALLEAHQAYRDAYALDQANAQDGLANSYDKLAALDEKNNVLPEALQKLQRAQEILASPTREKRIEEIGLALAAKRERRHERTRRLRYALMLVGLSITLILAIVFLGPAVVDLFSGTGGSETTASNGIDVEPAQPGETMILIADYEGADQIGFHPEGNLQQAFSERFPDIRVERTHQPIASDEWENKATLAARSVDAAATIVGWVANDSIGSSIIFVDPTGFGPVTVDFAEFGSGSNADLTSAELTEGYSGEILRQFEQFGLPDLAHAISGRGEVSAVNYLFARTLLQLAQVDPERAAAYVEWAESEFETGIKARQFAPIIMHDIRGIAMAVVPSGDFSRGRDSLEMLELCGMYKPDCDLTLFAASEPVAPVYTNLFFIDVTEVTNEAYAQCVDEGGCSPPALTGSARREHYFGLPEFAAYPVVAVGWEQADEYCRWRGGQLPTEAQWEKAARWDPIGGTLPYPWGENPPNPELANFDVSPGDTVEVASYGQSSPTGAFDMAGNVWEWVADWYQEDYYRSKEWSNPAGPLAGELKVFKGGSFGGFFDSYEVTIVDPAFRAGHQTGPSELIGFRCATDNPFLINE